MALVLKTIQTLSLLTLFYLVQCAFASSNITSIDQSGLFSLCQKLNKYGCNPTSIPTIMQQYINTGIEDYTLPTDPCLFESINMSFIFSHVDPTVLYLIPDNSYFAIVPCQILVQLQWFLIERETTYLITHDYWFGDTAQCDTQNTTNNPYNISVCNYTTIDNYTALINSNRNTEKCYDDDRCFYPFVRIQSESDILQDFGQCHCAISCEFGTGLYRGNIKTLDTYTQCCIWISLILIIIYFINLFLELKYVKEDGNSIMDLPITFEIPFICATALLSLTLSMLFPYLIGKEYFTCETHGNAAVGAREIPQANWSCFIQGSIIYISFITIYTYFMVLSVCVWRYLVAPLKPLCGIHKKYLHLVIWIYILGLYVGLVSRLKRGSMGADTILGICASTLRRPWSYIFNWYPVAITVCVFVLITPLTMRSIAQVSRYSSKHAMGKGQQKFANDLVHLSIRLLLYTCFLCASCGCFMFIVGKLLFHQDKWDKIIREYVLCLVFESYFIDSGLSGSHDECILDRHHQLPIYVYFMQGTMILLISLGSFILSCSGTRYNQWKNAKSVMQSRTKSVAKEASTKNASVISRSLRLTKVRSVSASEDGLENKHKQPDFVDIVKSSPMTPAPTAKTDVVELTTV